jgi:hypothetical protein
MGRVASRLVPPPHTAASIKRFLSKQENIPDYHCTNLYSTISSPSALEDQKHVSVMTADGPGSSLQQPMALVISEPQTQKERKKVEAEERKRKREAEVEERKRQKEVEAEKKEAEAERKKREKEAVAERKKRKKEAKAEEKKRKKEEERMKLEASLTQSPRKQKDYAPFDPVARLH